MGSNASQQRADCVIAIDGPAASGKSSVARELALRLGFIYVNSGGFYRAITWYFIQKNIRPEKIDQIGAALDKAVLHCTVQDNESRILIDNIDPGDHLRDDDVNGSVSRVSRVPRVRQIVSRKLHDCARGHHVVIEGRDIGSVVFRDTPYKFYLDASPEVRLQRRAAQGERDEIAIRDRNDVSRALSPLVIAPEAQVIDTSNLTIEQVVDDVMTRLKQFGLSGGDCSLAKLRARG